MHLKNGRPAKVGDPVVGRVPWLTGLLFGTITMLKPGDTCCDAAVQVADVVDLKSTVSYYNAPAIITKNHSGEAVSSVITTHGCKCSQLLHVEDLLAEYEKATGILLNDPPKPPSTLEVPVSTDLPVTTDSLPPPPAAPTP